MWGRTLCTIVAYVETAGRILGGDAAERGKIENLEALARSPVCGGLCRCRSETALCAWLLIDEAGIETVCQKSRAARQVLYCEGSKFATCTANCAACRTRTHCARAYRRAEVIGWRAEGGRWTRGMVRTVYNPGPDPANPTPRLLSVCCCRSLAFQH